MLRRPRADEITKYVEDARQEMIGAPRETERNMRASVIVELADRLAKLGDPDLENAISKAIHMGEWCPERDKCLSGRSAQSDAAAKAALTVVRGRVEAEELL